MLIAWYFAISVCVVSLVRLGILIQSARVPDPDWTYNGSNLTYWTLIEGNTGIVVACIMTLKPLTSKYFPSLLEPSGIGNPVITFSGIEGGSERPFTLGSSQARVFSTSRAESEEAKGGDIPLQDLVAEAPEANKHHNKTSTAPDQSF